MFSVSACSRLLGTLSAMPRTGVQGMSQQNSELLQRVSLQQNRLYSIPSDTQEEIDFTVRRKYSYTKTDLVLAFFGGAAFVCCWLIHAVSEMFPHGERWMRLELEDLVKNQNWIKAALLISRYDFPVKFLEEIFIKAYYLGGYNFVDYLLYKFEWSNEFIENFSNIAARKISGYKYVKRFIETGKLSPQVLFYYPYRDCSNFTDPYTKPIPAHVDSLLYTVLREQCSCIKEVPQETWDFVEYLLGKGADFLQVEAIPQGISEGCKTVGEHCLRTFLNISTWKEIDKLIEISKRNLGPRAISILEKKRETCKKRLEKEREYCKENNISHSRMSKYYQKEIVKFDARIEKLKGQYGRIQEG